MTPALKGADIFKRAAYWLIDSAVLDFNDGTVHGKWLDDADAVQLKNNHEEKRMLAQRLRAMSRIISGRK